MTTLIAGQNAVLPPGPVAITVRGSVDLGSLFGVAVLPEGGQGWLSLRGDSSEWVLEREDGNGAVAIDRLPLGTERIHVGIYARRSSCTIRQFLPAMFEVGGHVMTVSSDEIGATFLVFAELYLRNGSWKVRARADWSVAGLHDFARRHGCSIKDDPDLTVSGWDDPLGDHDGAAAWSGSAFLVGPKIAATNAHVVDGAMRIVAVGDGGRFEVEPILMDEAADIALVRVKGCAAPATIPFRAGFDLSAGEQVFAIGFPMSGFLGAGPQISSGMVANCIGPRNDTRLLQITAPIQPGSSGGPVIDTSGRLVGVAVASLTGAQNVNFAVRAALVSHLAQAVGIDVNAAGADAPLAPDRILRAARGSLFRLECSR